MLTFLPACTIGQGNVIGFVSICTVLPAQRAISSLILSYLILFPSWKENYESYSSYFFYTYTSMQS